MIQQQQRFFFGDIKQDFEKKQQNFTDAYN